VDQHGVRLGWGKGATPGVSGSYQIAGQPAAVWNLNVNAQDSAAGAYLYFYLGDLTKRLPGEQIEAAARVLEEVTAFKPKIAEARGAGWNKYPSVYLRDVANAQSDVDAVFNATEALTDRPAGM